MIDVEAVTSRLVGILEDDWDCVYCDWAIKSIVKEALELIRYLTEEKRCKNCIYWEPGIIRDKDDFIPPRCRLQNEPCSSSFYCAHWKQEEAEDANQTT